MKWGNKYDHTYVNRLYNNLKFVSETKRPFITCEANKEDLKWTFNCITDNNQNINEEINIININDIVKHPLKANDKKSLFTIEKLSLFNHKPFMNEELNILLDIDILFLKNPFLYIESLMKDDNPKFIKNYWSNIDYCNLYSDYGTNYINSSFVSWKNDSLKWIYDYYIDNKEILDFKYNDLDLMLFNCLKEKLFYHDEKLSYSFNSGLSKDDTKLHQYSNEHIICLFNTSHGRGIELHEAINSKGWIKEFVEQFN